MVRLIMGANGAGKTKQLIELVHSSVESETGSVVCIEPNRDMTYDISYNVRLVTASEYNVNSFECLRGFICGLYAGNYDISHVFARVLSTYLMPFLCIPRPILEMIIALTPLSLYSLEMAISKASIVSL